MLHSLQRRFLGWYDRHYKLNLTVAAGLFLLQLVHLYWLAADVILLRLVGREFFDVSAFWQAVLVVVDYVEIPALIGVSLVYIRLLREPGRRFRSFLYLAFLNSQWIHILWITDEFVVEGLIGGVTTIWPVWLAWLAIVIDYLELPVIVDTVRAVVRAVRDGDDLREAFS